MKVDLHIHTSYSDGAFSPEKIVDTAIDAELGAIAITDHDNVLSYKLAQEYAKDKSLEIFPGVEIMHTSVQVNTLQFLKQSKVCP